MIGVWIDRVISFVGAIARTVFGNVAIGFTSVVTDINVHVLGVKSVMRVECMRCVHVRIERERR